MQDAQLRAPLLQQAPCRGPPLCLQRRLAHGRLWQPGVHAPRGPPRGIDEADQFTPRQRYDRPAAPWNQACGALPADLSPGLRLLGAARRARDPPRDHAWASSVGGPCGAQDPCRRRGQSRADCGGGRARLGDVQPHRVHVLLHRGRGASGCRACAAAGVGRQGGASPRIQTDEEAAPRGRRIWASSAHVVVRYVAGWPAARWDCKASSSWPDGNGGRLACRPRPEEGER
mmetsp:Transcript_50539/g.131343  ORF Transcript_50539/g.131343 Transcript_50539/m.131343 type:complete len:230 (-) Transcript_50539:124-813(-)